MRPALKIIFVSTLMLLAAPASAKGKAAGKASFDDLFAPVGPKAKVAKVAPKARVARAAPAPKAKAKPTLAAAGFTQPAAPAPAPALIPANTLILADWAPERHALAGP